MGVEVTGATFTTADATLKRTLFFCISCSEWNRKSSNCACSTFKSARNFGGTNYGYRKTVTKSTVSTVVWVLQIPNKIPNASLPTFCFSLWCRWVGDRFGEGVDDTVPDEDASNIRVALQLIFVSPLA